MKVTAQWEFTATVTRRENETGGDMHSAEDQQSPTATGSTRNSLYMQLPPSLRTAAQYVLATLETAVLSLLVFLVMVTRTLNTLRHTRISTSTSESSPPTSEE